MIPPGNTQQDLIGRLRKVAPVAAPPAETVETRDFDWASPNNLTRAQIAAVEGFARKAAANLTKAMTALLRADFPVDAGAVLQQYEKQLAPLTKTANFYATLNNPLGEPCGCIVFPASNAAVWVAKVLGGSAGGERELSALETALLQDLMTTIAGAFGSAIEEYGGKAFTLAGQPEKNLPFQDADSAREFCRIGLRCGGQDEAMWLVVMIPALAPVTDGSDGPAARKPGENTAQHILSHLKEAPVTGQAWVGAAALHVRDLIALEKGDVLLLNRGVNEPMEFTVGGKVIVSGHAADCDGHYALQVVCRGQYQSQE